MSRSRLRSLLRGFAAAAAVLPALASATAYADDGDALMPSAIATPEGPASLEGFGQDYDVSPANGLPSLSYPLELPPARAGHAPMLGLSYGPGSGAGVVGLDWRLDMPVIERSTRLGLPEYGADDTFVLRGLGSGEELVEIAPGVFRAEIESGAPVFVEFEGEGFVAYAIDGTRYEFGLLDDSRTEGEGGTFRWALDAIVDMHGNRVDYGWTTYEGSDQPLLTEITYNDGNARIELEYEARPDPIRSRKSGVLSVLNHRLSTIDTFAADELVRHHSLGYGHADGVVASQLLTIECEGAEGTAMPTWTLGYHGMDDEAGGPLPMAHSTGIDPQTPGFALVDVDGDGAPDLLDGTPGHYSYRRNLGGAGLADWIELDTSPSIQVTSGTRFADFSGDGITDMVVRVDNGPGGTRVFVGGGEQPFSEAFSTDLPQSFALDDPRFTLADINADGRVDAIWGDVDDPRVAHATNEDGEGPGFEAPQALAPLPQGMAIGTEGVSLVDVDGDGMVDLSRLSTSESRLLVAYGTGRSAFTEPEVIELPMLDEGGDWSMRDINGDGAADLVRVGQSSVTGYLNDLRGDFILARDSSFGSLDDDERIELSDFDGDGTLDALIISPNGWAMVPMVGNPAGMLATLENGMGGTVRFFYESISEQSARASDEGDPWRFAPGMAMSVLRRTVLEDGTGWTSVTDRTVRDGYYDADRAEFRGFVTLETTRIGDEYTEDQSIVRSYDVGQLDRALKGQQTGEDTYGDGALLLAVRHEHDVVERAPGVFAPERVASETIHYEGGGYESDELAMTRVEFDYDEWGNLIAERNYGRVHVENGLDIAGDEVFTFTTYAEPSGTYGPRALPAEVIVEDGEGNTVSASRTFYDGDAYSGLAFGSVERGDATRAITWVEGDTFKPHVATKYDAYGNVVGMRDGEGGELVRTYDALGLFPVEEQQMLQDGAVSALVTSATIEPGHGRLTSITRPGGHAFSYAYDDLGRITDEFAPGDSADAPTRRYAYHLDGSTDLPAVETFAKVEGGMEHSVSQLDGFGRGRTTVTADDAGDGAVVSSVWLDAAGQAAVQGQAEFAGTEAFEIGTVYEPGDVATVTHHDALGRVVRIEEADGRVNVTDYEPLTKVFRDNGDLTLEAPYVDSPRVTRFDGQARVVEVIDHLGNAAVPHAFEWDAAGRLIRHVMPDGAQSTFLYDGAGRRTFIDSADAGEMDLVYDDADRLVARFDALGGSVEHDYDTLGRPTATRTVSPQGELVSQVLYAYDRADDGVNQAGQLVEVRDDAGLLSLRHDARGNLVRRARTFALPSGPLNLSTVYTYDAQDRVVAVRYPDGPQVSTTLSSRGLPVQVGNFVKGVEYDAQGLWTDMVLGNDAVRNRSYDPMGRVLSESVASGGVSVWDLAYDYDTRGMLFAVHDNIAGGFDLDQRLVHDDLGRLLSANGGYGDRVWTYGNGGNLLSSARNGDVTPLLYDGPQPHAATALGEQQLTYDAAGRLTTIAGQGQLTPATFDFDAQNRLRVVHLEDGTQMLNVYDHEGQRAIRRHLSASGDTLDEVLYMGREVEVRDDELVRWIFVGSERVAKSPVPMPSNGYGDLPLGMMLPFGLLGLLRKRRKEVATAAVGVAGGLALTACAQGGVVEIAELEPNEDTRYELQDRLGSASVVLAQSGEVVTQTAMEPYGETWAEDKQAGETGATYRFTDKELDVGVGTIYIGMRHYMPELGRWASPDPKFSWEDPEAIVADPREGNVYRYGANSPMMQVDPDGRDAKTKYVEVNINLGFTSFSGKAGYAVDNDGRVGIFATKADATGASPGKKKWRAKSPIQFKAGDALHKNDNGIEDLAGRSEETAAGVGPFEMGASGSENNLEVSSSLSPGSKGPSASFGRSDTKVSPILGESKLGKLAYRVMGTSNPITGINKRASAEVLNGNRSRTTSRMARAARRAHAASQK